MNRRFRWGGGLFLSAIVVLTAVSASEFDLSYPLKTAEEVESGNCPGTPASGCISNSGTNSLCLPYLPRFATCTSSSSLCLEDADCGGSETCDTPTASDLRDLINDQSPGTTNAVISISRFVKATDLLQTYAGVSMANNFDLIPGEGYRVQVNDKIDGDGSGSNDFEFQITGRDDPNFTFNLHEESGTTPVSASGTTDYCPPYHRTADTASDLENQINASPNGGAFAEASRFLIGKTTSRHMTAHPPTISTYCPARATVL